MSVEADLERRIADAFKDRARSLPVRSGVAPMLLVRDQRARRPTRVLVVALVTLLVIGAAGVFVAVRRSGDGDNAVSASGSSRYRSTAIVRIAPQGLGTSGRSVEAPDLDLSDPLALARGMRAAVLRSAHLDQADLHYTFEATANRRGTQLSLVVTAPTRADAMALPKRWENLLSIVRRHEAKQKFHASAAVRTLQALQPELATIDGDLARLDPVTYRDVVRYDAPLMAAPADWSSSASGGGQVGTAAPPPVPENGSVHELNLAFERIQLLGSIRKAGENVEKLRGEVVLVVTQLVSQTPATPIDASRG